MSSESPKACDSRFYCFVSDYRARIFGSARLELVFSADPESQAWILQTDGSLGLVY